MCMKGTQSHHYSAMDRKYVNGSLADNDRLSMRSWNVWIPVEDRPLSGLNGVPREAESSF